MAFHKGGGHDKNEAFIKVPVFSKGHYHFHAARAQR